MKNADRPVYPTHGGNGDDARNQILAGGLTKREYFAAMAMQGILANKNAFPHEQEHFHNIAEDAIRTADELLKQLES